MRPATPSATASPIAAECLKPCPEQADTIQYLTKCNHYLLVVYSNGVAGRLVKYELSTGKTSEAAIRRAKLLILAAKEQAEGSGGTDALSALFGGSDGVVVDDVVMGDASDAAGDDSLGD